ncbi:MAG: DUF4364 family protein [Clostridia bacterium]|nr:DUF4364 family protein [Clostridia bacterium]
MQKLMILYSLQTLGPVTETQLLQFLTDLDAMNYIEMRIALMALADSGEVTSSPHPEERLLTLTQTGKECIQQFAPKIPASTRRAIERHGDGMRKRFRNEQQTQARTFVSTDGRQYLQLRLTENDRILLSILIRLPAGSRMTFVQERWFMVAEDIYNGITRYAIRGGGEFTEGELKQYRSENCELILDLPAVPAAAGECSEIDPEQIANETIRRMQQVNF